MAADGRIRPRPVRPRRVFYAFLWDVGGSLRPQNERAEVPKRVQPFGRVDFDCGGSFDDPAALTPLSHTVPATWV